MNSWRSSAGKLSQAGSPVPPVRLTAGFQSAGLGCGRVWLRLVGDHIVVLPSAGLPALPKATHQGGEFAQTSQAQWRRWLRRRLAHGWVHSDHRCASQRHQRCTPCSGEILPGSTRQLDDPEPLAMFAVPPHDRQTVPDERMTRVYDDDMPHTVRLIA